jgi:peptidoglycan-associated lipoprotein
MSRLRVLVALLLVTPVALGSKGCKEEPVDPNDLVPTDLVPPDVTLQVISIDPAAGVAETPWSAQLFGAEFDDGAQVRVGNKASPSIRWLSDNAMQVTVPAMPVGAYDVTVTNPDGEKAVLRRGVSVSGEVPGASCRHLVVYFDYDSSDLRGDSASALAAQLDCLASTRGNLRLEGHCDERGTTEYNIALGERRAHAVQRYLLGGGVSPGRVSAVSYGEERPAVPGADEDAWSRNRRVEIRLQD